MGVSCLPPVKFRLPGNGLAGFFCLWTWALSGGVGLSVSPASSTVDFLFLKRRVFPHLWHWRFQPYPLPPDRLVFVLKKIPWGVGQQWRGLALLRLSWVVAAADVSGSAAPLLAAAAPVPAAMVAWPRLGVDSWPFFALYVLEKRL